MQHLLVDGRWCRLSEVDDPRLILSDVMHQHNSTTKHQQSTKLALYSTKSKLTLLVVLFEEIHMVLSLTRQYQKCEGGQFPNRGQQ